MNMPRILRSLTPVVLGLAVIAGGAAASSVTDTSLVQATTGFTIQTPPRVFLDSPGADIAALQKGIAFVEWVAAAADAQVVVSIKAETAAGGETVTTFVFHGQKEFSGDDETFSHSAPPGGSPEDLAAGLNQSLKLGLMRYVGKTPVAKRIDISLRDKVKPTAVIDPWNFWVFSLSTDGFFMGYETYKSRSLYGSISANRTTLDWKIPAVRQRQLVPERLPIRGRGNRQHFGKPQPPGHGRPQPRRPLVGRRLPVGSFLDLRQLRSPRQVRPGRRV